MKKLHLMLVMVAGVVASQSAWCVPVSEYSHSDEAQAVDRSTASVSDVQQDKLDGNQQAQAANSPSNGTTFRAGNFK